jgi:hypothetical protein
MTTNFFHRRPTLNGAFPHVKMSVNIDRENGDGTAVTGAMKNDHPVTVSR